MSDNNTDEIGVSTGENHRCDLCDTIFATVRDLIDHDCDEHREEVVATDGGTTIPDDHPLSNHEDSLDTHEGHLNALGEYLTDADPDEIESVMLVVSTDDATDTIPTIAPDAEFEVCVWYQLAAHISHVANAFGSNPEAVAKHGLHVLRDHQDGDSA